jgi:hypothetical protein
MTLNALNVSQRKTRLAVSLATTILFLMSIARASSQPAQPNNVAAKSAVIAFERLKKLEGKWKGRSTRGWEETIVYRTIAGGSVLVEESLDAHPKETMMTMFHFDVDRLILTHYCIAKNQPRLVATSFAEDGSSITFTFQDGTNLPDRDRGHMDKVVFQFIDDDHFSSQWTWYQNGEEKWMEEIKHERIK